MRDKVYAWLLVIVSLAVVAGIVKCLSGTHNSRDLAYFVLCPIALFLLVQLSRRGAFGILYDIEKDRIPLSQINRGPRTTLPPLTIDIPTITPSMLISHAPTTHLRVVENLNPTVPSPESHPHLTVVTRDD